MHKVMDTAVWWDRLGGSVITGSVPGHKPRLCLQLRRLDASLLRRSLKRSLRLLQLHSSPVSSTSSSSDHHSQLQVGLISKKNNSTAALIHYRCDDRGCNAAWRPLLLLPCAGTKVWYDAVDKERQRKRERDSFWLVLVLSDAAIYGKAVEILDADCKCCVTICRLSHRLFKREFRQSCLV